MSSNLDGHVPSSNASNWSLRFQIPEALFNSFTTTIPEPPAAPALDEGPSAPPPPPPPVLVHPVPAFLVFGP